MNAYNIKFQVGKRVLNWQRFADNRESAEQGAIKALDYEYNSKARILRIRKLTDQETGRLKAGHFRP